MADALLHDGNLLLLMCCDSGDALLQPNWCKRQERSWVRPQVSEQLSSVDVTACSSASCSRAMLGLHSTYSAGADGCSNSALAQSVDVFGCLAALCCIMT
jgi:hypothetical protein